MSLLLVSSSQREHSRSGLRLRTSALYMSPLFPDRADVNAWKLLVRSLPDKSVIARFHTFASAVFRCGIRL